MDCFIPKNYNYGIYVYDKGIRVITKYMKYPERVTIVADILANYYPPEDIVIYDSYKNKYTYSSWKGVENEKSN